MPEHHPYTKPSPNWSMLRILQNTIHLATDKEKTKQPHKVRKPTRSNQTDEQKFSPFCRFFLGPLPLVLPIPEAVLPVWSHLRNERLYLVASKDSMVKNKSITSVRMDVLNN